MNSFTPEGILRMQIEALERDLLGLSKTLDELRLDGAPQAVGAAAGDLRPRFAALIQSLRIDLTDLEKRIEQRAEGQSLEDAWQELLGVSAGVGRASAEYLRCLPGAMIRRQGLDGGWLEISDHLLRGIGHRADIPWPRMTILTEGELHAGLTDAIGARFGSFDIWSLPIVVHELGHFVAPHFQDPQTRGPLFDALVKDLQDRVREENRPDGRRLDSKLKAVEPHANELFADLFAVYVLGPAYAYTCVLLRFDPAVALEPSSHHPADDDRCQAILQLLLAMGQGRYRMVVDDLATLWRQSVGAAGGEYPKGQRSVVAEWAVEKVLPALVHNLPEEMRYTGWSEANRLAAELAERRAQIALGEASIADVLNAAWFARWRKPERARDINTRSLALARQLASEAAHPAGEA